LKKSIKSSRRDLLFAIVAEGCFVNVDRKCNATLAALACDALDRRTRRSEVCAVLIFRRRMNSEQRHPRPGSPLRVDNRGTSPRG